MAFAYAAVISLMRSIEHPIHPISPDIIKPAYEELEFLREVFERWDGRTNKSNMRIFEELDAQLREAVCRLEDLLQSGIIRKHIVDRFLMSGKTLREEYIRELERPSPWPEEDDDDALIPSLARSTTVGLSNLYILDDIMNQLLYWKSGHEVVALVGMAGIGKTHLAMEIYHHPVIVRHFDNRTWMWIGQKLQIHNILVEIATQMECQPRNLYEGETVSSLMDLLHKKLYGKRYLIILDDVWSTQVLDELKRFLPVENGKGSRFLVTTRLPELADYPSTIIHRLPFLNNEESWNLFCQNVFDDEEYLPPPQLEIAGRQIAAGCEGLPLLILTVANILRRLDRTQEYWNMVAEKKTSTFEDAYDQIFEVINTSYVFLPQHLRVCFLYMGVFPHSCDIPLSKLINLWCCEDLLETSLHQTFQDIAMEYLDVLVSHNLVLVSKRSANQKIKSYKLHSSLWHFLVTESRRNMFFCVLKSISDCSIEEQRRLSVQNNILFSIEEVHDSMEVSTITTRSLLCTGEDHQYPVPVPCLDSVLLKVLDALAVRFYEFPAEVVQLLQLRYLALTHNGGLPPSISQLQLLQCMIVRQHHNIKFMNNSSFVPKEIWEMRELRHLGIMGSNLPDPSYQTKLPNLLTLYVNAPSCTRGVLRSIPHLVKLGIRIEFQPETDETISCFEHIWLLYRLESLKCVVMNPELSSRVIAQPDELINLPRGLEKLSLNGLGYTWKYMSAIGSLPELEVLKLRCCAFQGPDWKTEVGEFKKLKYLLLEDMDLVQWRTKDDDCFPRLERLIIGHCYKLREIPLQIGDIQTLQEIKVVDCSPSFVASVNQLLDVHVDIISSWDLC